MKRIISVLVVLTMVLSSVLIVMPVSAASGTAINNASDFLNMADNGAYYLAKDITITEAYSGTFSGSLDGNGKSITLSGASSALFMIDGATVKNLTLKGEISKKDVALSYGALAPEAKNCVIDNVDSQVKITIAGENDDAVFTGMGVGGIIGYARNNVTIKNCDNSGAIKVNTKGGWLGTNSAGEKHGWFGLGGIVGKVDAGYTPFIIDTCTNSGALTSLQARTQLGGMVGEVKAAQATIRKSNNNGEINFTQTTYISSPASYSGIAGIVGATDFAADGQGASYLTIYGCNNTANVTDNAVSANTTNVWVGGILGRCLSPVKVTVSSCKNSGTITNNTKSNWSSASGIVACFMSINLGWTTCKQAPDMKILNCENTGAINGRSFAGGILGTTQQLNHENGKLVIEGCLNSGVIASEEGDAGGIVAAFGLGGGEDKLSNGTIKNTKNTGSVTGAGVHAGGVIGYFGNMSDANFFTIENCTNSAAITSNNNAGLVGGIAGKLSNGALFKVINCASNGTIGGTNTATKKALIGNGTNVSVSGSCYGSGSDTYGTNDATNANTKVSAALVKAVDNTDLVYLINYVKTLNSADYTSGSWSSVSTALSTAESAKSASVQTTIDNAASGLENAIKNLALAPVDTSELAALIEEAEAVNEDEYEFMGYANLMNVLANAKKALGSTSKSTVDAATVALQEALDALVPAANNGGNNNTNNGDANNGGADNGEADASDDAAESGDEAEEKKGCGSSIAATAVVLSTVLALGAGVAFRKKED